MTFRYSGERDDLDCFKTLTNLTAYAASGSQLDRRENSRNSVVMRHPCGDKIVIARGEDDHWIYFSVRDDTDSGSIIDFIQHRRRCSHRRGSAEAAARDGVTFVRPVPELEGQAQSGPTLVGRRVSPGP